MQQRMNINDDDIYQAVWHMYAFAQGSYIRTKHKLGSNYNTITVIVLVLKLGLAIATYLDS